jgi:hypothetical protein
MDHWTILMELLQTKGSRFSDFLSVEIVIAAGTHGLGHLLKSTRLQVFALKHFFVPWSTFHCASREGKCCDADPFIPESHPHLVLAPELYDEMETREAVAIYREARKPIPDIGRTSLEQYLFTGQCVVFYQYMNGDDELAYLRLDASVSKQYEKAELEADEQTCSICIAPIDDERWETSQFKYEHTWPVQDGYDLEDLVKQPNVIPDVEHCSVVNHIRTCKELVTKKSRGSKGRRGSANLSSATRCRGLPAAELYLVLGVAAKHLQTQVEEQDFVLDQACAHFIKNKCCNTVFGLECLTSWYQDGHSSCPGCRKEYDCIQVGTATEPVMRFMDGTWQQLATLLTNPVFLPSHEMPQVKAAGKVSDPMQSCLLNTTRELDFLFKAFDLSELGDEERAWLDENYPMRHPCLGEFGNF